MAATKAGAKSSPVAKKTASTPKKPANTKVSTDKVSKTPQPPSESKETFRFGWSKKRAGASTIQIKLDEASADLIRQIEQKAEKVDSASKAVQDKRVVRSAGKTLITDKAKSLDEFSDNAREGPAEPSTPRKRLFADKHRQSKGVPEGSEPHPYESDQYEESSDESSDSDYHEPNFSIKVDPLSPSKRVMPDDPSVPQTTNPMERHKKRSAHPPDEHDPNGRKHGRNLVHWHRPRMLEKAMLFLDYECHQNGIEIPWDKIVARMQPGSSGAALTQHLEKTRLRLVQEGHIVPPDKHMPELEMGRWVRALVRKDLTRGGDPGEVRIVTWDEKVDHPKYNLETPGIVSGSGKYRRGENSQKIVSDKSKKKKGSRLILSEEYQETLKKQKEKVTSAKTKARRARANVKRTTQRSAQKLQWATKAKATKLELVSEADSDSDGSYREGQETPKPRRSTRKGAGQKKKRGESEMDTRMMRFGSESTVASKEVPTLPVKLSLSPKALSNFPGGQTGSLRGEDLEADQVKEESFDADIAENEDLEGDNTEEAVNVLVHEDIQSTQAPLNEHDGYAGDDNSVAEQAEGAELEDEMSGIDQQPDLNIAGDNRSSEFMASAEQFAATNGFVNAANHTPAFSPRVQDDVFRAPGLPNMMSWGPHSNMMSLQMQYSPNHPFVAGNRHHIMGYNGYNVTSAVAHDQQVLAAHRNLAFNQSNDFDLFHGQTDMHTDPGSEYHAGSVTPRLEHTYFGDFDENDVVHDARTPPPAYPGEGDHGYGNSPYLQ